MKLLSFVIALLLITLPCLSFPQQTNDVNQALIDAVYPQASNAIPVGHFIGKSPEYISAYMDTHETAPEDVHSLTLSHCIIGCMIAAVVVVVITAIELNKIASEARQQQCMFTFF